MRKITQYLEAGDTFSKVFQRKDDKDNVWWYEILELARILFPHFHLNYMNDSTWMSQELRINGYYMGYWPQYIIS